MTSIEENKEQGCPNCECSSNCGCCKDGQCGPCCAEGECAKGSDCC